MCVLKKYYTKNFKINLKLIFFLLIKLTIKYVFVMDKII